MTGFNIWMAAIRPKTLWAAVAPVLVGVALAVEAGRFHLPSAALALVGALLIQIGTNFYNDYADFRQGADDGDRKGPLRVTQAGLVPPATMLRATLLVFGLAVAAGGYLMWRGGWPIVVIGALSILCGFLYTAGKYSLAYLGLGDLFVLVFFGPVAVGGTYYVQALDIQPYVLVAGLAPGLLAVAILLVNNIRDVDEDRRAGKKTIVVRFGRSFGLFCYAACMTGAALVPVVLLLFVPERRWVVMTTLIMVGAAPLVRRLFRTPPGPALNPLLADTARFLLLYSVAFSISWNL